MYKFCNLLFRSEALVGNICAAVFMIHRYYSPCQLLVGYLLPHPFMSSLCDTLQPTGNQPTPRPSRPTVCATQFKVHAPVPLFPRHPSIPIPACQTHIFTNKPARLHHRSPLLISHGFKLWSSCRAYHVYSGRSAHAVLWRLSC